MTPRRGHGYCTDDVARALAVLALEPVLTPELERLAETCLSFVEGAQRLDGRFHNRRAAEPDASWTDNVGSDDSNGRALYSLGVAGAHMHDPEQRLRAARAFAAGAAAFESPSPRANAQATIGAAELLTADGDDESARALLDRTLGRLGAVATDPNWPWPEARLAYDNARIPEAWIAAGVALGRPELLAKGLTLLEWLVEVDSRDGHFSFTPVDGSAPGEPRPRFDQQPLEACATADACARAFSATGEERWAERTLLCAEWFFGRNDAGITLADAEEGSCCDGLQAHGRNENCGAESTLALLSALQRAREIGQAAARSAATISPVSAYAAPTQRSAAP